MATRAEAGPAGGAGRGPDAILDRLARELVLRAPRPGADFEVDGWWRAHVNWSLLRELGGSRFASIAALAPFLGYVVLLLEGPFLEWLRTHGAGMGSAECPAVLDVRARIHMLYLGAVIFGLGVIVFRLFCPGEVREFRSTEDFVERVGPFSTERNLRAMFGELRELRADLAAAIAAEAPWLDRRQVPTLAAARSRAALTGDADGRKLDVMRSYYNALARWRRRWAVWSVLLFFAIGGFLAFAPSLATMAQAACVVWP